LSTGDLALGEQLHILGYRLDERVTCLTARIIHIKNMEPTRVRLEDHVWISALSAMDDKVIPVVTDVIFLLDLGEGKDIGHGILRKPNRLLESIYIRNG
jgi:hypothetical protein